MATLRGSDTGGIDHNSLCCTALHIYVYLLYLGLYLDREDLLIRRRRFRTRDMRPWDCVPRAVCSDV